MLLAVDVGNTVMVLGIYDGQRLRAEWTIHTDRGKTMDEYGLLFMNLIEILGLDPSEITAVAISSSVPPVVPTLEWMSQKYFKLKPLVIGPGVKTGMVIRYDNPREVGADRIVSAVAAYEKYGGPLIIVDFGTAMRKMASTWAAPSLRVFRSRWRRCSNTPPSSPASSW